MNDDKDNPASAQYLRPEQLRVGIFVKLELFWFKHDFTRSDFKITNEKQLREVLALRLPRYRYDPERSDAPAAGLSSQQSANVIPPTPDEHALSDDPHLVYRSDVPATPSQALAETMPELGAQYCARK